MPNIVPDEVIWEAFDVVSSSTGPWNFGFQHSGKGSLRVAVDNVLLSSSAWTLTSGAPIEAAGFDGGSFELIDAVEDARVVIWRDTVVERDSNLSPSQLTFLAINATLNHYAYSLQEMRRDIGRALLADFGTSGFSLDPADLSAVAAVADSVAILSGVDAEILILAGLAAELEAIALLSPADLMNIAAGLAGKADTSAVYLRSSVDDRDTRKSMRGYFGITNGGSSQEALFQDALDSGLPLDGDPGLVLETTGQLVVPPAGVDIQGHGMTWRGEYVASAAEPVNQRFLLNSALAPGFGTVYTVTYTPGGVVITASATVTDIVAGDVVGFFATTYNGRWPICYRRVRSVAGANVTIDGTIPYAMTGTVTMRKVPFNGTLSLKDITFDLSEVANGTEDVTGIIRCMSFFKRVIEGCTFDGIDLNQAFTNYIIYSDYCKHGILRDNKVNGAVMGGSFASSFRFATDLIADNEVDGDLFGFAGVNGDKAIRSNNRIRGRYPENPGASLSVRGFRDIGLRRPKYYGNEVIGMDSGLKLEDVWDAIAHGNSFLSCNTCINQSDQNPGPRSGGHQLTDNNGEEFLAYGIVIGTTDAADGEWRTCSLKGNRMGSSVPTSSEPYLFRGGSIQNGGGNEAYDWASTVSCYRTITNNGRLTKGIAGPILAVPPSVTGRRGPDFQTTHVGLVVDHDQIICPTTPKIFAMPPRKFVPAVCICRQTVNMNTTADQALTLELPDGFSRYRLLSIIVTANGAAGSAVGGIYRSAAKAGTQIVAGSQTYTLLTAADTNQNLTISAAGVQEMTDLSLFFALTTAHGVAATAELIIIAYPVT